MKNTPVIILICACLVLSAFLGGLYIGRNIRGEDIRDTTLNVPTTAATRPTTRPAQQNRKVNINTADIYTLMHLEGIGETYAQRIIDYREINGPFEKIEDIMNVPGIGEKRFEAIKDLITV